MLGILKKLDTFVEFIQFAVCGLIVLAIMWLTFFSVIFRYVLNNSIVWAEEVLRYLMMWVVLVGAGLTTREDQHVSMDIMQSFLKRWPKARAVHYFITRLIVFVFYVPSHRSVHRPDTALRDLHCHLALSGCTNQLCMFPSYAGSFRSLISACSARSRERYMTSCTTSRTTNLSSRPGL